MTIPLSPLSAQASRLSDGAFRLWIMLHFAEDRIPIAKLCKLTQISRATAQRRLRELRDLGLVENGALKIVADLRYSRLKIRTKLDSGFNPL